MIHDEFACNVVLDLLVMESIEVAKGGAYHE
jgi:hypothetical protein